MHYSGADWLKLSLKKELSPLGEEVADLLGLLYRGIYHISKSVDKVDWSNKYWIEVNINKGMSSFDLNDLTELVLLAHWMCIRVEINPCMRYLKLIFTKRTSRTGDMMKSHPTIDAAVSKFKLFMQENNVEEA